jgi:2-polyprenyl-3-methyl-5-hydroxy-6-metoxy-1,4-benzoquinol methylase
MMGLVTPCCQPDGYRNVFTARRSKESAARYRSHGLDSTATRIVDFLVGCGIEGASVLEIGGGVGQLHLELLRRGAARATSIELVDSYDADARALAGELGLTGRVTRLRADLAADPDVVGRHDIVVMHRVVCCYPDADRLLSVAAEHASRALVFSHPPRNVLSRAATGAENLTRRMRRQNFQVYVHDPASMAEAAADGGRLRSQFEHRGFVWHVVGFVAEPSDARASTRGEG